MRNYFLNLFFALIAVAAYSQAGHIMQGVSAVNMSMGGAATGQPLDISGALHWNPAAISSFDENSFRFDLGIFFSSPELSSTVPEFDAMGMPTGNFFSGTTEDDRGISPLPNLAFVWANPESRHSFGASAFGISGFGVTFPENMSNPINAPQSMGGFGRVESEYLLLQVGATYAYELSDKFSVGIQPTFNLARLDLMPNPTANPTAVGYPSTESNATVLGFGGQIGLFYDSGVGFKAGASYKTPQTFGSFEFDNIYLDNTTDTNEFDLDYPGILSFGVGYTTNDFDFAVDYRWVNYEDADGFSAIGWTPTFSVEGFGWENMNVVSAGIQYRGIDRVPLRLGYTYSSNPINEDSAFFSIPATAVIKNAFQFGLSYEVSDRWGLDGMFHYGTSGDTTSGPIYNPQLIGSFPPFGAVPGSEVSYDMNTSMIMVGLNYKLNPGGNTN